ncbi:hypothetical protein NEMIN01_2470 [Nematocida minor]|uniref:uncharacterized protein n=1 Tax=Nematocida minor TaxID=1912983 RepID=UPI00222033CD|nr:uncharacterized protein NEMIN01_2470 [Nematocida minor]KAI5193314.1 hypothetical protein NEMIN01_2470 [Nematocida minor]
MKEVKLVIDIKGIVETCKAMKSIFGVKMAIECDNNVGRLAILKHMLKDNLKIEDSSYSADDNQYIIKTAENEICQSFIYRYPVFPRIISKLNDAIKNEEKDEIIRSYAIELANELMEMNPLVYNPEHGISRKTEAVEKIKLDASDDTLGARTCTLEINDAMFPSLRSMADYTTESLNRDTFYHLSSSLQPTGMFLLKDFASASIKEYYTVYGLYTKRDEKTNLLLVNYGLYLIHENYFKILGIIKKIKKMNNDKAQKQSIIDQVNGLFASEEDFKVVFSVIENIESIIAEKSMQKHMISEVAYITNNIDLLGGTGEPKTLKLGENLSVFARDFIEVNKNLKHKVDTEVAKLRAKKEALETEKKEYDGTSLKSQNKMRTISDIENDIISLEWKIKKEESLYGDILFLQDNLQFFDNLSQAQVNYLHMKIKGTLEAQNPKAKELEKPEEAVKAPETKLNGKEQPPFKEQVPPQPVLNDQPPLEEQVSPQSPLDEQPKTDMHAQPSPQSPLDEQPSFEEQAPPHPASTKSKIVSALKIVVSVFLVVLFIVSTIFFGYRIENRMKSTNN